MTLSKAGVGAMELGMELCLFVCLFFFCPAKIIRGRHLFFRAIEI